MCKLLSSLRNPKGRLSSRCLNKKNSHENNNSEKKKKIKNPYFSPLQAKSHYTKLAAHRICYYYVKNKKRYTSRNNFKIKVSIFCDTECMVISVKKKSEKHLKTASQFEFIPTQAARFPQECEAPSRAATPQPRSSRRDNNEKPNIHIPVHYKPQITIIIKHPARRSRVIAPTVRKKCVQ